MTFEEFATNHKKHVHCISCVGCILDPNLFIQTTYPVWCINCKNKIKEQYLKMKMELPWIIEFDGDKNDPQRTSY